MSDAQEAHAISTMITHELRATLRELTELKEQLLNIKAERDALRREVSRQFHAWSRDDLKDWGDKNGVVIGEGHWRHWCTYWTDVYNLQYEQEAMEMAMNDWWERRVAES